MVCQAFIKLIFSGLFALVTLPSTEQTFGNFGDIQELSDLFYCILDGGICYINIYFISNKILNYKIITPMLVCLCVHCYIKFFMETFSFENDQLFILLLPYKICELGPYVNVCFLPLLRF